MIATFYKGVDEIIKLPVLNEPKILKATQVKTGLDTLSMLLGDEKGKKEIKLEVYLNRGQWDHKLFCEFRIGLTSMTSNNLYILKDIGRFLLCINNNIPVNYGKNFTFNIKEQKISVKDRCLIEFIQMLISIDKSSGYGSNRKNSVIDGKYIHIPDYLLKEFFSAVIGHRVYLNEGFLFRTVQTEIIHGSPDIDFDLKKIKDDYILKVPGGMPVALSSRNNVFLFGTNIYLPDYEYCSKIEPYLSVFNKAKVVTLEGSKEDTILRNLIPSLNCLSKCVTLGKSIREKVVIEKCEFKFYFDKENKDINLTTKVKYGVHEFNIFEDCSEKIIYRDSRREEDVLGALRSLGFQDIDGKFFLMWGDDYTFRFFKSEVEKLQKIGEVFYSENFKGIKSLKAKGITGNIRTGKYSYLDMDFKLGDISPSETSAILRAFRDNLKYYKLKSGEYLDLEEIEMQKFLKLIDSVCPEDINDNHIEIPKNKAIYLDEYMEENGMRYIKGKTELKKIRNKLKNIESLSFKEPENIQGTLREYQKVGYNWFKTLDYLGFGGILGDEMGLGKTLQAITFLLSNKGSKSLIVVPTSLLYNWANEFEMFAPNMKAIVVNGPQKSEKA